MDEVSLALTFVAGARWFCRFDLLALIATFIRVSAVLALQKQRQTCPPLPPFSIPNVLEDDIPPPYPFPCARASSPGRR